MTDAWERLDALLNDSHYEGFNIAISLETETEHDWGCELRYTSKLDRKHLAPARLLLICSSSANSAEECVAAALNELEDARRSGSLNLRPTTEE